MRRKPFALTATTTAAALVLLAACGGGDGSGNAAPEPAASLTGAGPITLVQGKDTSGFVQTILDEWNASHPGQEVTLVELPEDADAQRQQMIQNAQAQSDAYDVLVLDNIWTAEFAANRYVVELPEDRFPTADMLPPVIDSARYRDKLYGVPNASDGGLLYYRKDLLDAAGVTAPPRTWAELKTACEAVQATPAGQGTACYAGQFEKYEGLTVNFTEAVDSAGGDVTADDGTPNVNTPEAKAGLDFLVTAFQDGTIPQEAITYKEEEGRRAFQEGRLIFHRQWPYQYALAERTDGSSQVAGRFAVAPLPGLDGPGTSSLGGHALAISTYSANKQTALEFISFYTSKENSQRYLELGTQAPIYTEIYDDPELQAKFPFLGTLKESILNAEPRPKVVRYGDATLAIQDAAYAAIRGEMTTEEALAELQTKLEALNQ